MNASNSTQIEIATEPIRIGAVAYLNAAPLIDGLSNLESLEVVPAVPSSLIDLLHSREVDLAMCSSIDYQRSDRELLMVPCGIVGSTGRTMTVRLFSRCPIDQIQTVACDTHSHTSVVLMQILLKRLHNIDVQITPLDTEQFNGNWSLCDESAFEALMLIGDKAIHDTPPQEQYQFELDLGLAWHEYTGLPFCFAIWLAHTDLERSRLSLAAAILDRQRRLNLNRMRQVLTARCQQTRWSVETAYEYTTDMLDYVYTEEHKKGLNLFFDEAYALGFIDQRRPLIEM